MINYNCDEAIYSKAHLIWNITSYRYRYILYDQRSLTLFSLFPPPLPRSFPPYSSPFPSAPYITPRYFTPLLSSSPSPLHDLQVRFTFLFPISYPSPLPYGTFHLPLSHFLSLPTTFRYFPSLSSSSPSPPQYLEVHPTFLFPISFPSALPSGTFLLPIFFPSPRPSGTSLHPLPHFLSLPTTFRYFPLNFTQEGNIWGCCMEGYLRPK